MLVHARRTASPRVEQPDAGVHELLEIFVTRNDHDIEACGHPLLSQRSDHIVGFITVHREDWDAKAFEQLNNSFDPRVKVRLQLIGELLAGCLVRRVDLMTEGEPGIVHPTQIVRPVLGDQSLKEVDNAPRRRRILAARGR